MEKVVIEASERKVTGKQVRALRREGKLPGVLYGHNFKSLAISMDLREASKALASVSSSSIINIHVDGKEHSALVREKQRDYIRGTLKHVDFQVVSLTEKLRTKVGIVLVGLSPAVKDLNGIVVTNLDELEVECLPQYLPEKITVDISKLAKIGDGFYVRDVDIDKNVEVLTHPDEMIVVVSLIKTEEEPVAAAAVEAAAEEPEVIEKGKKVEEVPE
jgi:large subunit ribosomal protein L25